MQCKVRMKRHVSLRMKAVSALKTLFKSYFCSYLGNVYFNLGQTWITFRTRLKLDYLKLCLLFMSSVFIDCICIEKWIKLQSHWRRFVPRSVVTCLTYFRHIKQIWDLSSMSVCTMWFHELSTSMFFNAEKYHEPQIVHLFIDIYGWAMYQPEDLLVLHRTELVSIWCFV